MWMGILTFLFDLNSKNEDFMYVYVYLMLNSGTQEVSY